MRDHNSHIRGLVMRKTDEKKIAEDVGGPRHKWEYDQFRDLSKKERKGNTVT